MHAHDEDGQKSPIPEVRCDQEAWWSDEDDISAGSWLFRAGEPVHDVFCISRGLIKLVREQPHDRDTVVGLRWPGSLVGAVSATLHDLHRLSACALLPTRIRRLPARTFRDGLRSTPAFLRSYTDAILMEFRADLDDSMRACLPEPEQRLHSLLCASIGPPDHWQTMSVEIQLPTNLTLLDLSDLLHVPLPQLSLLLNAWKNAGWLRRDKAAIKFHRDALGSSAGTLPASTVRGPLMLEPPAPDAAASPIPDGIADQRVRKAVEFIRKESASGRLDLRRVSREVNLSLWHLSRLFKRTTGLGFREFLSTVRLDRAREALRTTHLSVKEVAAIVGYNHTSDFTRRFKAVHGISPTEYRARMTQR